MNSVKLAPLLLIFAEVARYKSFSQAAKKLGLSKSAVSQQISRLESEVKMQLLARNTRGVELTTGGAALLERSELITRQIDHVMQDIQQVKAQPCGRLRVSVPPFFEKNIAVPALKQLLLEFPRIEPELVVTERWCDLIEHQLDVTIFGGDLKDSEYKAQSIGRVHDVFTASSSYLRQNGNVSSLAELTKDQHRLIATPWQNGQLTLMENGKPIQYKLPHNIFTNSLVTLIEMLQQDMGIALLPQTMIEHNFVHLLPTIRGRDWHFYFIHRYRANKPSHISRFYELIHWYFSVKNSAPS